MSHLLIVFPLKKEMSYFQEGLSQKGWQFESSSTDKLKTVQSKIKKRSQFIKSFSDQSETKAAMPKNVSFFLNSLQTVTLAVGGHGKVQFGIQTQHFITNLADVSSVICLGAAGSLVESLNAGDLVVAEKTVEHDYTNRFGSEDKLPEFFGHPEFLLRAKEICKEFPFKIHLGSVASGDEDIVDPHRASELYLKTKADAVAWEGAGGARASAFHKIPFMELRAITDNARHSVAESFAKNLQMCMHNASDFIHKMVSADSMPFT